MNQPHIDFVNYHIWANQRLINDLSNIDESTLKQEVISSFSSIHETVRHLWFAEVGWLGRMQGRGWNTQLVSDFSGTSTQLFESWKSTSREFTDFVVNCDVEHEVAFIHKGESFLIPNREIIQTVVMHGSYHRGQIVMMLRQFGVDSISQTDYIEWVRERARGNI